MSLYPLINDTSENDESFLKKFLIDIYYKIIDVEDFSNFEIILSEFIIYIDKNVKTILELMKNHKESETWFSSIIGFFYQHGIGCDNDKNKEFELYLLAVNNEKSSSLKFTRLRSLEEENVNEFDILKSFNIIIGKYLLSLFYYRDIILRKLL
jgi:hypothetical protein